VTPRRARAQAMYANKRYDLAVRELQTALQEDPSDGLAFVLLADSLALLRRPAEARAASDRALELVPDSPTAWTVRANVLNCAHQFAAAEEAATTAIRMQPQNPWNFEIRARSRMQLGRTREALKDADHSLALRPGKASVHALRASILTRLGNEDDAVTATTSALQLDPESAEAHAALGWQFLHSGDTRRALDELREALRIHPDSPYARAGLVQALKARNPAYAAVLRPMLWSWRRGFTRAWPLVGIFLLAQVVAVASSDGSAAGTVATTVSIGCVIVLYVMWTASPLFNFVAWLSPDGRHVFRTREVRAGATVAAVTGVAIAAAVAWAVTGDAAWRTFALFTPCTAPGLVACFQTPRGRRRSVVRAVFALALAAEALGIALMVTGIESRGGGGAAHGRAAVAAAGVLAPVVLALLARSIALGRFKRAGATGRRACDRLRPRRPGRIGIAGRRGT
jgi:tetratricopeptide (TPR) repeat protein